VAIGAQQLVCLAGVDEPAEQVRDLAPSAQGSWYSSRPGRRRAAAPARRWRRSARGRSARPARTAGQPLLLAVEHEHAAGLVDEARLAEQARVLRDLPRRRPDISTTSTPARSRPRPRGRRAARRRPRRRAAATRRGRAASRRGRGSRPSLARAHRRASIGGRSSEALAGRDFATKQRRGSRPLRRPSRSSRAAITPRTS
jgi:hypothetical protein